MSIFSKAAGYAPRLANYILFLIAICSTLVSPVCGAVVGGYAISTTSHVIFVDGDGLDVLAVPTDTVNNLTGLANGNVVGRMGADAWRLYDASGVTLTTRTLDNSGTFNDAAPVGGGGYAAVSDTHVIFMAADGDTVNTVTTDSLTFVSPLTNGNLVGYMGSDNWRTYTSTGGTVATRNLDNLGVHNASAAKGGGGFVDVTSARLIFVAADGTSIDAIVDDPPVVNVTTLSNGNVVGRFLTDVWRLYDPNGNAIFTRQLDNLGTFAGAAAVGGGGYVAYSNTHAIFVAADGNTVNNVLVNSLEFVTSLNNGNVVGRLIGTDDWRLYDPLGNILATRTLDNLGTFTGAAPTGLAFIPEPATGLLALIAVPFIAKRLRRYRRQLAFH